MKEIMEVFSMQELSVGARISIIKKLGTAINFQYGANITEPLVYELVMALDPSNEIMNDQKYTAYIFE